MTSASLGLIALLVLSADPAGAAAAPPLQLSKSMQPSVVQPGDTVTVCLTVGSPPGTPMADIVWVVDRTGSMGTKIDQIVSNISQFTSQLAGTGIDYRQGLVYFPQSDDTGFVSQGWAANDAQLNSWLSTVAASTCCGTEPVLQSLQAAAAFSFRPGASRTLILVTDENVDCRERDVTEPLSLSGTVSALAAAGFSIHTIACDCNGSTGNCTYDCAIRCNAADIPSLANGIFLDIAAPVSAWSGFLTQLGAAVASYNNVVLRDPLPPQLLPVPGQSDGGVLAGSELVWTLSSLGRGDSFTRCFLSTVAPGFSGSVNNSASVSADGVSPTTDAAVPIYYVTPTFTITPTPTISPTHSITQTFTNSMTSTISPTHTHSPTVTATPTASPTFTATPPPLTLALYPPNPNPSKDGVWLPYRLGTDADVDVKVWTVAGEPVCDWPEGFKRKGVNEAFWNNRNSAGTQVGSGVFLYRVRARSPAGEERQEFGKCAVAR